MAATAVTSPADIHTAMLNSTPPTASDTSNYHSIPILQNEIAGLHILSTSFTGTHICPPLPADESAVVRLFLFYRGSGSIENGGVRYDVDDMALLVTDTTTPLHITAVTSPLLSIQLHWQLTLADPPAALPSLPYYQPYSTARTYTEAIKSPRTTSRTLLPPGVVPRLAMGSVRSEGPDSVAPHVHAMLEQLFVGVRGCDCVVECDGVGVQLVEGEVLHIPLGSMHGVRVAEGKLMEYVWMDFFLNQADGDRWIATMHKDDPV